MMQARSFNMAQGLGEVWRCRSIFRGCPDMGYALVASSRAKLHAWSKQDIFERLALRSCQCLRLAHFALCRLPLGIRSVCAVHLLFCI